MIRRGVKMLKKKSNRIKKISIGTLILKNNTKLKNLRQKRQRKPSKRSHNQSQKKSNKN